MKQINRKKEYQQGVAFAILCSSLWGLLPIYWKSLETIDPMVILLYRLVLSFIFALILTRIFYKREDIVKPLKEKRLLRTLICAGLLVTMNWGLYIWAVNNDHIIQTSVGYYIEPLIVCVFGLLFFRERMNRYKVAAFLLACTGVAVLLVYYHQVPTIALVLALSFAVYSAIKKKIKLDAVLSLLYETVFLVPPALAAILYFEVNGRGVAANATPFQLGLLALAGVLTGLPLVLFTMAANRINLITLGVTQYVSPSITLLLGIFIYHEPFGKPQLITFAIIWMALAVFTFGEIKESRAEFMSTEEDKKEPEDRFGFAGGIKRVTAGKGGEALLIAGSEKTALVDCGMAYCGDALAENIKKELGERPLDYVILTHTHYDHIGGLPYLRKVWPGLTAFGAAYGKEILKKDSARTQIETLSAVAWKRYSDKNTEPDILMGGLSIDRTVSENDVISLGDREIRIFETPGHTNCSLTLLLEPGKVLFPSETVGVYVGRGKMITGMLKSYRDTVASIEKCRRIDADYIIAPHYGQVPEYDREAYWDLSLKTVEQNRKFILEKIKAGATFDEILEAYTEAFYYDFIAREQIRKAFVLNAQNLIRNLMAEFQEA